MLNISIFIDSIFMGLRFFIPLLILLKFSKVVGNRIDIQILITATNLLLLFAATAYLTLLVSEIFVSYYSQSNYEQLSITSRIFDTYYVGFAIWAFIYSLLPQMMWLKKVRLSIISTIVWASSSYILPALIFYPEHFGFMGASLTPSTTLLSYLKSLIIFISLLTIVYFILLKQQRSFISKQQA